MAPIHSYVLWFSQRVGSTVFAQALEDTGVLGRPREWFNNDAGAAGVLAMHGASDAFELRELLWKEATTSNGVLAIKYGMHADHHQQLMSLLGTVVDDRSESGGRAAWDAFFPRCKHVFMTRRDKVRLAISWWRAINTGEWHRPARPEPTAFDGPSGRVPARPRSIDDERAYDYDAIAHLVYEACVREADIQRQLERWAVTPYTVIYEDLVDNFEPTVRGVLEFLDISDAHNASIARPAFARLADDVSERWYERYLRERSDKTSGS
ncbi:MAG TPA: Stf0 family sulfotransferase [Kofleriaceae bacterium]|jgi:LPS sulfotransferase NodH